MKKKKAPLNTTLRPDTAFGDFDSFEELFKQAEQQLEYWVEGAKIEFTEKTVQRMQALGMTRTELAERLGKKQSHITKLLSGNNNFTIETMVQIAEALDCKFHCHLEPAECQNWLQMGEQQVLEVEKEATPSIADTDETFSSAA